MLETRRVEGNIGFPFPALNVTTLIIDIGDGQFCSFGIFLEYERLIYFFNGGDSSQLGSGGKYLESCSKLSDSDIFGRLRCEVSISELCLRVKV